MILFVRFLMFFSRPDSHVVLIHFYELIRPPTAPPNHDSPSGTSHALHHPVSQPAQRNPSDPAPRRTRWMPKTLNQIFECRARRRSADFRFQSLSCLADRKHFRGRFRRDLLPERPETLTTCCSFATARSPVVKLFDAMTECRKCAGEASELP